MSAMTIKAYHWWWHIYFTDASNIIAIQSPQKKHEFISNLFSLGETQLSVVLFVIISHLFFYYYVYTKPCHLTEWRHTIWIIFQDGLSVAAIVGISIGGALIVIIIVVTLIYVMCLNKAAKITSDGGKQNNNYGTHDNPTFDGHTYGNVEANKVN